MEVKKLRELTGMNIKQFSQYFKIPYRTVQSWELSERKCPEYLLELMKYKLNNEKANAPVVHGEWIELQFNVNQCSQCKAQFDDDIRWIVGGGTKMPKFCPECGADMRKGGTK